MNLTTATESDYHYQKPRNQKGSSVKRLPIRLKAATRERRRAAEWEQYDGRRREIAVLVQGSAVAGDGNVALGAGNNVDIVAATNTDTSWRFKETKRAV